ncbi:fungal-specific transcription factor domain-containing protein [Aspergillus crustosus]
MDYTSACGEISTAQPSVVGLEDIQYLSLKGCFFVPAGEVLDEFIRKYFLYVHPCLPVMDEAEFWKMYYHTPSHDFSPHLEACNGETNGINLLAFQAMLFASCPFVSAQALNAVGFPDARSARNIFYTRAKLLYDLCPPNDSLQTIQASILLSQHMPTTNIHTGAVWLSIAIQNAIVYNAFSPSQTPNPGFNEKETEANTKKRVWWCILLRDRIMALGLRRAPLITSDTSIGLEIGAFEGTVPGETDIRPENEKSEVYDPEANRLLARVFGVLCEFVNVLGDVLHVLHSGSNAPNLEVRDGINSQADAKTAQTASTTQARIAESKAALLRWSTNAKGALGAVVNSNTTHESVGLFFGLTFFYYHTARLALSNFEALTLHLHLQSQQETETETETKLDINDDATYGRNQCYLEDSIGCITDTIKRFLAQGVAQYLPIDTMPLIAHPLLLSALDPRLASNKSQAATRKRRFRYYATLMQIYQARYEGTGTVAGFIQRTLQVAEGVVPRVASQTQTQTQTQSRDLHMDVGVSSWSELFVSRPSVYLRLSLLLDVAFRRGWYAYPGYQEIYKMLGTGGKAKNRGPDGINATGMGFMVLRSNVKAGENDTCAGGEASGLVSFDTFLDTSGGMVEKQEQEGGGLHLFSDSGAISIPAIRTSRAQVLDSMALSSYDQAMAAEYAYPLHLQSTLSFSTQGNLDYGYDLDQIQDH